MGTPSDALARFLGEREPSELLLDLEREEQAKRDAARVVARRAALAKARAAQAELVAQRRADEAAVVYHLHPADDPWSLTCRTLCALVRPAAKVISPKAASTSTKFLKQGCDTCRATLAAWKLFGNNKPLTYRRWTAWRTEETAMQTVPYSVVDDVKNPGKTKREAALEKALAVLTGHDELVDGQLRHVPPPASVLHMDPSMRLLASDMLIGLVQLETARRMRSPEDDDREKDQVAREMLRRRAWHVELARLKLPAEVLRALRGL